MDFEVEVEKVVGGCSEDCWVVRNIELPTLWVFTTSAETERGLSCPVTGVTVCEAGCGKAKGPTSIFAAAGWQEVTADGEVEVAAGEVSGVVGGGILLFGTLTPGSTVGAGVLTTWRGRAAFLPTHLPWTCKRGIGLKGTVRPTGLSLSVGGLWTWGGSQFLRVQGSVDETISI